MKLEFEKTKMMQQYLLSDHTMQICILATLYAVAECKQAVTPAEILLCESEEDIQSAFDFVIKAIGGDDISAETLAGLGKAAEVLRLTLEAKREREGGIAV